MRSPVNRRRDRPPKGQAAPAHRRCNLSGKADSEGIHPPYQSGAELPALEGLPMSADTHRPAAPHPAARPAPRTRRPHGAVRRLRDAGAVPGRHPGRAPPVPPRGRAVRRLAHGPAAAQGPRRRRRARDAGAGRRRSTCRSTSSATRFFTNAAGRHARRPDDHAPRGRPVRHRQRRVQGRRHRAPARRTSAAAARSSRCSTARCWRCRARWPCTRSRAWRRASRSSRS